MRLAICILFSLVSSLIAAPLEHSIAKRQLGYGSPGTPVISNFPQPATTPFGPTGPTPFVGGGGAVAGGPGVSPAYLSGYGNGLSLGMAAFGNVGAGLGIGGLGVGGPLLNRIPTNTLGIGFGAPGTGMGVPTAGLGVAGPGLAGMGGPGFGGFGAEMGGLGGGFGGGFGGAAGAEMVGVPGGPYVPGDFGIGPLEVVGPYSLGGIYGPYGWNGLGGRAAQWGIEFGPWDYPFLRLERFEDMLNFNRNLNCVDGAGFNIMCVNGNRNPGPRPGPQPYY